MTPDSQNIYDTITELRHELQETIDLAAMLRTGLKPVSAPVNTAPCAEEGPPPEQLPCEVVARLRECIEAIARLRYDISAMIENLRVGGSSTPRERECEKTAEPAF